MGPRRNFSVGENKTFYNFIFMGHPNDQTESNKQGLFVDSEEMSGDQRIFGSLKKTFQFVKCRLRSSAIRRKSYYDFKAGLTQIKAVGRLMWHYLPCRFSSRSARWRKSYRRPFLIFRATVPVNYVLQRSAKAQQFVVHVDSLKKCLGPTPDSWLVDQPDRNGSN